MIIYQRKSDRQLDFQYNRQKKMYDREEEMDRISSIRIIFIYCLEMRSLNVPIGCNIYYYFADYIGKFYQDFKN
jgi:hypothetical protein